MRHLVRADRPIVAALLATHLLLLRRRVPAVLFQVLLLALLLALLAQLALLRIAIVRARTAGAAVGGVAVVRAPGGS